MPGPGKRPLRACTQARDRSGRCTPPRQSSPGRRASSPSLMASIIACLFFQERESLHEIVNARARPLDPLPQRLVLRLQLGVFDRAAAGLQLRLGFLGARTPARQLLRHVADDGFELIDRVPDIRPVAGVRQVRPPSLSTSFQVLQLFRVQSKSYQTRGTYSAT